MNIGTASSSIADMPWSIWPTTTESGMALVNSM